jgi:hypothetical protein
MLVMGRHLSVKTGIDPGISIDETVSVVDEAAEKTQETLYLLFTF